MTHVLKYMDDVPLPDAVPEDNLSTGTVESSLMDSLGGAYNYFGATQRLPRRQQFTHKGKYVGEMFYRVTSDGDYRVTDDGSYRVTSLSKVADLAGKVGEIKAKIGVWGQVWRERIADGVLTWKQCRLLQVKHEESVDNADVVSEVECLWETLDVGWRSAVAVSTSVGATNGLTAILNVQNGGSIPVRDAILRIARTSGTITQVTITGTGIDITWTGSIGASQTLTIDAGKQTVLRGTSDQYSGFALNVGHTSEDWLPLALGANLLFVTVTGGNATVSVEHYDQWP